MEACLAWAKQGSDVWAKWSPLAPGWTRGVYRAAQSDPGAAHDAAPQMLLVLPL